MLVQARQQHKWEGGGVKGECLGRSVCMTLLQLLSCLINI
jgi:hypothetical protein